MKVCSGTRVDRVIDCITYPFLLSSSISTSVNFFVCYFVSFRENLIFLVAALPRETRKNLSYTLKEFVLRCSFNSQDCDMKRYLAVRRLISRFRDFKLHMDPEYGNCCK